MDPSLQVTSLQNSLRTGNIKHSTSSPRNPRSNGQAESAVKIVKGLLTHAKCSGQDPYLALLAYRSTPVDSHLRSPAEMLYQHALCTTVPQKDQATRDPYAAAERERLEERATQSAADHDRTGCRRKAPHYAGQSVSVINNDRTLWLPATIVRAADHGSYIIKVIGGAEYRRARDHIRERHPDAVKPDTHPKVEVAGTTYHHSINLRSCTATANTYCSRSTTTCCSRNTQASCSPKPYSSNPHSAEDTCNHRCSPTDRQN